MSELNEQEKLLLTVSACTFRTANERAVGMAAASLCDPHHRIAVTTTAVLTDRVRHRGYPLTVQDVARCLSNLERQGFLRSVTPPAPDRWAVAIEPLALPSALEQGCVEGQSESRTFWRDAA